jgi:transcriptional regulator with XRE-family HTH domain
MYSRSESKEQREAVKQAIAKRTGEFLLKAYRATGFSRQEAADRAGISIGYLTGILANRIVAPNPDIIRNMARHWGFNVLDYYIVAGVINRADVEDYVAKNDVIKAHVAPEINSIYERLVSLPKDKQAGIIQAVQKMLETVEGD